MAIKISGTNVINDSRQLENITNLKTVAGQAILGTGDITTTGNYKMQVFTSTTPATWTKPTGLQAVKVTVVGGGAGTLAAPTPAMYGGGGAGGTAIQYIPAPSIPGPVTVTVGAGGGTTSPAAGGTSSFGPFCSATGGSAAPGSAGAAGGAGSGGTYNITGESGGTSDAVNRDVTVSGTPFRTRVSVGGAGGSSIFGGGGSMGATMDTTATSSLGPVNGKNAVSYGGGASGKVASSTGGNGFQGIVIVEEFY